MAMSKDRVEFTLKSYYFTSGFGGCHPSDRGNQLLTAAFNLGPEAIQSIRDRAFRFGEVRLIVRPSQFARFLILREQLGFQNQFKELKAKLITPVKIVITNDPIDISGVQVAKEPDHVR